MASGLRPIPTASATGIWGSAISSGAARNPVPDPNQPECLSLAPTRGRPNPGGDGARCGADAAAMPRPPRAGTGKPYFQKEFFHNGYIKSLKQLVHFYNTRDFDGPKREQDLLVQGHVRSLPGGNRGKGDLLAAARGQEQHRHDDRRPRLDR